MSKKKTSDALSRSDTVFIAALAIILATASAAIGSAMTYNPSTDKSRPVTAAAQTPAPVQVIAARGNPDSISLIHFPCHCIAGPIFRERVSNRFSRESFKPTRKRQVAYASSSG